MNTTPLQIGDKILVTKGSRPLGVKAGNRGTVVAIRHTPGDSRPDVTLRFVRRCARGHQITLYAAHSNRLADAELRLQNSNGHKIVVVRTV